MGVNMALFPKIRGVRRHGVQILVDSLCWGIAIIVAIFLRYDLSWGLTDWTPVLISCISAAVLQFGIGWSLGLYRGRYPYGSFDEIKALITLVITAGMLLFLAVMMIPGTTGIPRSATIIAIPIAFSLMGAVRYLVRLSAERNNFPDASAQRTLVYGAGHLGENVTRAMLRDTSSPYIPVGLIDDDPRKQHLRLFGVPMMGRGSDLSAIAQATKAEAVILCVARAEADFLRELSDRADAAGLRLLVLPILSEILEGHTGLVDLRDVAIEDIIGRHPVDTEIESIADYIEGNVVLVTGAGGSIGSELCRQLAKFSPRQLLMLDRDESGLHGTQMSIAGHGLLDTDDVILVDIRDRESLTHIMTSRKPDVVFHAAALKHLPMLEQYPQEAWQTNVIGTLNVLQSARESGVKTFVNISTDKAADPTSILGHSKRLGEQLTSWFAQQTGAEYLSVRFGNVLGSRGSVLPTFVAQIEAGGPVTVTHPEVTRFFMTIPEACQLVIQAGAIGRPAEVLILDMGQPVKILDVAKRMIAKSRRQIEVRFTGLRDGEKLHEDLIGRGESDERPLHHLISHTMVDPVDPANLDIEHWLLKCGKPMSFLSYNYNEFRESNSR
jgi:dTDP-glucose 4,6-dehydratase